MKKPPTSVAVVAWILITMGIISTVSSTMTLNNPRVLELIENTPLPHWLQYGMIYAGLIVTIGSGIALLKGRDWARFLYLGWNILGFGVGFATSPMKVALIPGLIITATLLFFLFRGEANNFFDETDS